MTEQIALQIDLTSEVRPDITVRVDDEVAHARVIANDLPYWPEPDRKGRRHQWAWWLPVVEVLHLECPSCHEKFVVAYVGPGEWECQCQVCAEDAGSAEDGGMPPCGRGRTPLEAAQAWMEES